MRKEGILIVILLAFSVIFSSFALATGCCLDSSKLGFCTITTPENCNAANYLEGVACADTGVCFTGISSCCINGTNKCQPAKKTVLGQLEVQSPLLCSDSDYFVKQACSDFSECQEGCALCGSSDAEKKVKPLYTALSYCIGKGGLAYFNTSIAENTSCANTPLPSPVLSYSVSGFVKSASNSPIANAFVTISGITSNTDSSGAYTISSVTPGTFTIFASHPEYFQNLSTVVVDSNKTGINFSLSPISKSTLIVVAKYPSGLPAGGVSISAAGITQITDTSGRANMGALPIYTSSNVARYYQITATLGSATNSTMAKLSESANTTITITVPSAGGNGAINGTILNSNGSAVSGVNVLVGGKSVTTGADGYYNFSNIPVGPYNIQASPPAPYRPATESVTVISNETITHDITLGMTIEQALKILTIQVNDNQSRPIPNANVEIRSVTEYTSTNLLTAENGSVSANVLQNFDYVLTISKTGYTVATDTININQDSTFTYELTPRPGLSISGWVKDDSGKFLQGVSVYISMLYEDFFAVTDANGYYSIAGVNYLSSGVLKAEKAGYSSESAPFTLIANNMVQNFTLTAKACAGNDLSSSPQISNINLQKNKSILKIEMTCPVGGYYVYRCEGTGCTNTKPITNIIYPETLQFTDETIEPGKCYTYELHSFFVKPFVNEIVSPQKTVCTGAKECFSIETNELCYNNERSRCDINNTIVTVSPASADLYCIQDGQKTKYLSRINCSLECNKPLGMFSALGVFNILIGGSFSQANCSDLNVLPALAYCYKDYAQTVVSKYYSCDNVKACYDYQSEGACSANDCKLDPTQECVWRTSATDLSLGVCMPKQEKYWNCSRCDASGKFNDIFGQCNTQLCDLYGGNTDNNGNALSHYCFFTGNQCLPSNVLSCENYQNNSELCLGNGNNVSVNILTDNTINEESEDLLGFGLCRFGSSSESYLYNNRCFKDADNNYLHDNDPTDMKVPFTSVIHPTAVNTINFPFIIYDDENSKNSTLTSNVPHVETYYTITDQYNSARPNILAQNNLISFAGLNQSDQLYGVWFYSKDDADNLEVVKSFLVWVDLVPPEVNFSYYYGGGTLNAELDVIGGLEDIRCTSHLVNEKNIAIPGDDLSLNNSGKTLIASYDVSDGVYFFSYDCRDWVNNNISGTRLILVDTEEMIYDETPDGITIKDSSVQISAKTMADAECRYIDASDGNGSFLFADLSEAAAHYGFSSAEQLFDIMEPFDTTGFRDHSSYVSIAEDSIAKLYLIRCKLAETQNLTQSNISQIRFTVDRVAPHTTFFEGGLSENVTTPVPFDTAIWRKRANILLQCVDPQSPTVLPQNNPNYAPREFGCELLNYCTAMGISCTPQPVLKSYIGANGSAIGNGTETQIIFNETRTVCFYSVDKGGNTESPVNCTLVPIDTISPRVKITGSSGLCVNYGFGSYCRVNESVIFVSGEVDNAAYWANKGGNLPYFKDFNFSAVINSSDVSQITFDFLTNASYDYLQLNFRNNQITYGQKGNVVTVSPSGVILGEGVPVNVSISTQGTDATITLNGIEQGTFNRTNTEGWIITGNQSVSDVLVIDPAVSSPMDENVSVFINGADTLQRIPIVNGMFSDTVDVGQIYNYGISGDVEFRVSDEAENTGKDSLRVEIDQIGPEYSPFFDPPINSSHNQNGENYDSLEYPLHYEEGVYYMGGSVLYLTGITTEAGERLELWNDTEKLDSVTQNPNQTYKELPTDLNIAQKALKGDKTILLIGDQTTAINQIGTEAYAIFKNHRTGYGNYNDAYPIDSFTFNGSIGGTILTLRVPLDYDVLKYDNAAEVTIVNKLMLPYRFKLSANISAPGGFGNASLQVRQYDDLNNPGSPSEWLPLIIDNIAPTITAFSPSTTTGVLPSISNISVEIFEIGSGLRDDNINFSINGQRLSGVLSPPTPGLPINGAPTSSYKFFYNYPRINGTYLIKLRLTDMANNPVEMAWNITLDSTLPRNPIFSVVNGVNISVDPDGWTFVNATPQVVADYREDGKPFGIINVFESWVRIENLNETVDFSEIPSDCIKISATDSFNCTIRVDSLGLTDLPGDGDYNLTLRSLKTFATGENSSVKKDGFMFVKDSQKPIIENFTITNKYMRSDAPISFSVKVPNERHKVKASLVIIRNNTAYNIFSNLALQLGESSLYAGFVPSSTMTNLPTLQNNKEYTIRLNVSDYAGNFDDTASDTVIIDDTRPIIYSDNITINATPLYIYRYPVIINGESVMYMIRKDIIEIFGRVPNDVQQLSFYKGKELIARVGPCQTPNQVSCIKNDTGEFHASPPNSVAFGVLGNITNTLIDVVAVDRAGNTGTASKRLYSDLENLKVRVCVNEDCTSNLSETTRPITNVSEMISLCEDAGQREDKSCYAPLIRGACTVNNNLYPLCVMDKISETKISAIWALCGELIPLYKDSCILNLAVSSSNPGLCSYISDDNIADACLDKTI